MITDLDRSTVDVNEAEKSSVSFPFKSIGSVVTRNLESRLVPFRKKEFDWRVEDTVPGRDSSPGFVPVFTFFLASR